METIVLKREEFPVIKINDDNKSIVQDQIKHSLSEYGFLVIENNFIEQNLVKKCYELAHEFFNLDSDIKKRYSARSERSDDLNDLGYHSFLSENARFAKKPDLKEFYHIGVERKSSLNTKSNSFGNKWPKEISNFRSTYIELWENLSKLSIYVLNHLATCFNVAHDYVDDLMLEHNSILRSIYYPALNSVLAKQSAVRAAQHTGINLIGLQCLSTASGLEFYTPSKEWVCLKQGDFDDCISVNMGEMLQYLTNDVIQATLHRVINHQDVIITEERQAIVFFAHPNSSKPLVRNGSTGDRKSLIAGNWVQSRLDEIKTRKSFFAT